MTHREYQRCAAHYDDSDKEQPSTPKRIEKPAEGEKLFYPEIKPLTQAEMMKQIWMGRLKIKEPT